MIPTLDQIEERINQIEEYLHESIGYAKGISDALRFVSRNVHLPVSNGDGSGSEVDTISAS